MKRMAAFVRGELYGVLQCFLPNRYKTVLQVPIHALVYLEAQFWTPAAFSRGHILPEQQEAVYLLTRSLRECSLGKAVPRA